MRIKTNIIVVSLILFTLVGITDNVCSKEERWSFNGYQFGYTNPYPGYIYLGLFVYYDMPIGYPHYYEPPWDPGNSYILEEAVLITPVTEQTIPGYYMNDTQVYFSLETNYPIPGEYIFKIFDDNSVLIYSHSFNLTYNFEVSVTSGSWIYDYKDYGGSFKNPIKENEISSIDGFQVYIDIENIGDIPYDIGSPTYEELNIEYQINLYKQGDTTPLDSTDVINFKRESDLFSEKNYAQRFFFASGENINCSENIVNTSLDLEQFTLGSYYVDGYVKFGELIYNFSSENILIITSTTSGNGDISGFELAIVMVAIALILFLKRKR